MLAHKHITLISLNFYPEDTAIGLYSTQMAEYLEEQGAQVSVITAFPYYPQWEISKAYSDKGTYYHEKKGTINIYRYKQFTPRNPTFLKRVAHITDFTIGSRLNFRQIAACDIVISIIPFTSSAWLGNTLSRKRNAKHWIHIQDFEFDAAFQSGLAGKGNKRSLAHQSLLKLERNILNKADRVSTISHAMLERLKAKTTTETYYFPNWIDAARSNPNKVEKHPYVSSEKFTLLYAGNVGDKQDWQFFKELVAQLDIAHYEVIVVGAGAKMSVLKTELAHTKVKFYDPVPLEELAGLLASADVHILFQKATVIDTVMPSKILGMMASARPSIVTGHPEAETAKVLKQSNGGLYHSGTSIKDVLDQLEQLRLSPEDCKKIGSAARAYVLKTYDKNAILKEFAAALSAI